MHVLVLGAGLLGVSSAWHLRAAGHEVTLIDRQPGPGLETSFANGGQISVCHAEPWATPHAPIQALRWLGKEDAPLLFRLRWDPQLLDWSLRFLRQCTPGRTRANIRAIVNLALYSRARLQALRRELQTSDELAYDHLERGILHLHCNDREYAAASHAAALMREFGLDRQMVDVATCIQLEPALAASRHLLVGGDWTPSDESGDAHRFTQQLAAAAVKHGVTARYRQRIERLLVEGGQTVGAVIQPLDEADRPAGPAQEIRADATVVALGSYTPLLLRPLGIKVPIYPAKGYSATLPLGPDSVAPTVSLTDDSHKIVISRLGQRLRIAGTAEFNGYNRDLTPARCQMLQRRVDQLFPNLRPTGPAEFWTGLRPATPSNVPLIGQLRPGLWLNSGHGTLGWTMSCGSGAALADLIAGQKPEPDFPFLGT